MAAVTIISWFIFKLGVVSVDNAVVSEAYHDWSGKATGTRLRVNFTLKLLLSQNFCNRPLMRFISFASNIGPTAAVPAGPAPAPLQRSTIGSYWVGLSCDHTLEHFIASYYPISAW